MQHAARTDPITRRQAIVGVGFPCSHERVGGHLVEILVWLVLLALALALTAEAVWLLQGWIDTSSAWVVGGLFVIALVFAGVGLLALLLAAIVVGAVVGSLWVS